MASFVAEILASAITTLDADAYFQENGSGDFKTREIEFPQQDGGIREYRQNELPAVAVRVELGAGSWQATATRGREYELILRVVMAGADVRSTMADILAAQDEISQRQAEAIVNAQSTWLSSSLTEIESIAGEWTPSTPVLDENDSHVIYADVSLPLRVWWKTGGDFAAGRPAAAYSSAYSGAFG